MLKATISETKSRLSALLDRVRHGESILIMDRDRPVARLEPIAASDFRDSTGRLARLERAGLVRRAASKIPDELLDEAPPAAAQGADILQALLREREEGR